MTKLLILSSDTGEGHNSAASAIAAAAEAAGMNPVIRKPAEESGTISRGLGELYNILLTRRPQWMRGYLRVINRARPNERDFYYSRVRAFIGRFLESIRPDLILSVHPMLNHFIPRFVREEGLRVPMMTFLTDPFPPFWRGWASPWVDRYFATRPEAVQELVRLGVPAFRIEQVPMPVRREFRPASGAAVRGLRRELGFDSASMILLNGGARGGGPLLRIYQTVRAAAPDAGIVVVCGRNARLLQHIEGLGDARTRTLGFVSDLHRYIAAADLVLTKPGALSAYEALACRAPVALMGILALMPQESGMFAAAATYGFGYAVSTFAELEAVIRKGPADWSRRREAIPSFYTPSSGEELIERIQSTHVRA